MASTYSTSLQLQLIATGEQSGIWGTNTNVNWNLIEQAVAGVQAITMANADYTLTVLNGVSDEARNMVLVVGGTNSAVKDIIAPAVAKVYVVYNNTAGGYAIRIKTSSGVAVSIPSGSSKIVYCDGTDFYDAVTKTGIGVITSTTGSEIIPVGTTAQRDAVAAAGYLRFNSTTTAFEGYNGTTWGSISGAVANGVVYENGQTISTDYTMTSGKNGESVGPITINSGVTVTIPSGSRWIVL